MRVPCIRQQHIRDRRHALVWPRPGSPYGSLIYLTIPILISPAPPPPPRCRRPLRPPHLCPPSSDPPPPLPLRPVRPARLGRHQHLLLARPHLASCLWLGPTGRACRRRRRLGRDWRRNVRFYATGHARGKSLGGLYDIMNSRPFVPIPC